MRIKQSKQKCKLSRIKKKGENIFNLFALVYFFIKDFGAPQGSPEPITYERADNF